MVQIKFFLVALVFDPIYIQAEMMCEHSLWSLPPSQLSCEASNQTTGRNGGRNLPVSFHNGLV